ncbi:YcxB family protein [Planctomycetota bacterium]|nr:YcxB family protein [Planctomycetota bacterium]
MQDQNEISQDAEYELDEDSSTPFIPPFASKHPWDWDEGEVIVTGQYNVDDYKLLHPIIHDSEGSIFWNIISALFLIFLTIAPMGYGIKYLYENKTDFGEIMASVGVVFIPIFLVTLLWTKVISKTWAKQKSRVINSRLVTIPSTITINDEGITWEDDRMSVTVFWESLLEVHYKKNTIYFQTSSDYIVLPKHFFDSQNTWDQFRLKLYRRAHYCQKCEYDLFASESTTCPECGDDLHKQIQKFAGEIK